jgi:hypothetical protein
MFQPSAYSLPASLTVNGEFAGMDYGADWRLKNVFSKKGRAENQKARAEYNRKRAAKTDSKFFKDWRNRRGDRFEMKSAQLKMEAEGKEPIAPTPGNSDKLWVQPYPWGRREERRLGPALLLMRSKTMEDAAKGYKPGYQLINSEYRATILGGVYILKYAMDATTGVPGYAPYTMMTPETVEIRGVGRKFDDQLIGFAKRGAREAGAPEPKNLKSAAEFIRKEVEARGLARPAWSHRALLIVAMASKRAQITSLVVGATLAATATIVTAGAAAPIAGAIIATGGAAAGAVGQVRTAKLGTEWQSYQLAVENALRKREEQITAQQLDAQLDTVSSLSDEVNAAAEARAQQARAILGLSFLVSVGIVGWGFVRRRRNTS